MMRKGLQQKPLEAVRYLYAAGECLPRSSPCTAALVCDSGLELKPNNSFT